MKKAKKLEDLYIVPQPLLREDIQVEHRFTDEERVANSDELAEAMRQTQEQEEKFKQMKATMKAELENLIADQNALAAMVRKGGEMRVKQFAVVLNPPGKVKYFYDEETLERIDTVPMNPQDFQIQMQFEKEAKED